MGEVGNKDNCGLCKDSYFINVKKTCSFCDKDKCLECTDGKDACSLCDKKHVPNPTSGECISKQIFCKLFIGCNSGTGLESFY
jgi:hypothetical protein